MVEKGSKNDTISLDRLKPAYIEQEILPTVHTNPTPTPTHIPTHTPTPFIHNTPDRNHTTSRSGRHVKWPKHLIDYEN